MYCINKENCGDINSLVDSLKVLSEENRLRIICYLLKNGERCVCEIQEFVNLPQNLVSHHLKVLKDADLLTSRKAGQNVFYFINDKVLDQFRVILNNVFKKGDA